MLLWTSNFSILRLLLKGYLIIFSYLILTLSNSSFSCLEASSHEYLSWIKNTLILYLDAYLAVRDIWKSLVRRRSLMEEVKPSKYCQQRVKQSSNFKTLARTLQLPSQGRRRSRKDKNRRKTGPYCTITIMTEVDPSIFTHILEMLQNDSLLNLSVSDAAGGPWGVYSSLPYCGPFWSTCWCLWP